MPPGIGGRPLPPVSDVLVDDAGWAWVRREAVPGAATVTWEVIGGDGDRREQVEVGVDIEIRAVHRDRGWAIREVGENGGELWMVRRE